MAGTLLGRKGQVSIEFILLIIVGLIYIQMVVWPLVNNATVAAEDVKRVSDTKVAAQKLGNAMNNAAAGAGESKATLHLFLPNRASIECDKENKQLLYFVDVNNIYGRNPLDEKCSPVEEGGITTFYRCQSSIELLTGFDWGQGNCEEIGAGGSMQVSGPVFKALTVTKEGGNVDVAWAG